MFDVITFGSATCDIFLELNRVSFRVLRESVSGKGFVRGRALCFSLGGKLIVDDVKLFSGGGGTNTACTFSAQGLKTAYLGKLGDDFMGNMVLQDLKRFNVSTTLLKKDEERKTALSVVLSTKKERTILINMGACHFLNKQDVPWARIKKAKWFYIAPLYGKSAELLGDLVRFARENKIAIAVNPSRQSLKLGREALKPILAHIDVLLLNDKEARLLSTPQTQTPREVLKDIRYICPGVIVITKGREGALVCDGLSLFKLEPPEVKVVEKTGAGDAFASGFVAGLFQKDNIEYAIRLAAANAEGCCQATGAKNGLLKRGQKIDISKYKITKSHL